MKKSVMIKKVLAILAMVFMLAACGAGNGAPPPDPASEWGAFNTSNLPYTESTGNGAYGAFAFDGDGNLLFVPNRYGAIWVMNRSTGVVSTVATGIDSGNDLLGLVYSGGYIYVGSQSGNIFKVNESTGAVTTFVSPDGSTVNGMVIAPSGFGSYGGQIIAVTYSGNIYAIDQSLASPTPTLIASLGSTASALVFGGDGTLYVAEYDNNTIVTVTSGGTVADFVTGLSAPDGLAYDSNANVLYVSDGSSDTLYSITIPGGVVSTVGLYDFDSGWYPSAILYDEASNILFMGTGETGLTIEYLSL